MRHERGIVILLCVFAAVRVLSLALAFPPFNPIDEIVHFDVILKYARSDVPRGLGRITSEAIELYVLYGWGVSTPTTGALALQQEPEYREQSPGRDSRVPVWTLRPASRAGAVRFLESSEKWKRTRNQEDTLVMIVPLSVAAAASIRRLHRTGRRAEAISLALLVGAAALPVASWWTRNGVVSGDLTGGRLAYRAFGWSLKTVSELTDHPVFHSLTVAEFVLSVDVFRSRYNWFHLVAAAPAL